MKRVNVAVLGLGFMGSTHVKSWQRIPGARLAAVMSSDERKLSGDLTSIVGNLGGSGELMDFSDVRKYRTIDAVLEDATIDAIDICLPTGEHSRVAVAALRAGKHVLVEKPLAPTYAEALDVTGEAQKAARILMTGQVLRFLPAYVELAKRIGESGRVMSAFFRRRCAAPAWRKSLSDPANNGGAVLDLLVHDADYCIALWGMPHSVRAIGCDASSSGVDIIQAELNYPGLGSVVVTGGWYYPKSYPFSMEFLVVTDTGAFEWSSASPPLLRRYAPDGEEFSYGLGDTDPFTAELTYFADCVLSGRQPVLCPPQQSAQSIALVRFMLESRSRNGEPVQCLL